MEKEDDTSPYILATSPDAHTRQLRDPEVFYKSIVTEDGRMVGFVILRLDPDGVSVELARIVVARKGRSYGARAMALIERVCREDLDRTRIWLDVFEFNPRARNLYQKCGYARFGESSHQGELLELYEKDLSAQSGSESEDQE